MKSFNLNQFYLLNEKDCEDYKNNLHELIYYSYNYIGGYPNLNTPNEIVDYHKKRMKFILGISLEQPNKIDGIIFGKLIQNGIKYLGLACNEKAKKIIIEKEIQLLNSSYHFIEASDKLSHILLNNNVPIIKNKNTIENIINRKINMVDDVVYERVLFGQLRKKILFGKLVK